MIHEEILITVRTYPNPSVNYRETVCTGGITRGGEWRRLYPVTLRYLEHQYKTFDVIDVAVEEVSKDGRPETRRPNANSIEIIDHLDTMDARMQWVGPTVMDSMQELIDSQYTLRPVRVQEVEEFVAKPGGSKWTAKQQQILDQDDLFTAGDVSPLEKIPFEFRLVWKDGDGVRHDSLFIAWEVCQTWRKWAKKYRDPIDRMRSAWLDKVCSPSKAVHFFMGNYWKSPKTYGVCGIFNPPKECADAQGLW